MEPVNSSTSRLINNTMMLYLRTLLIMFIGLFSSRVILQSLGIDDFGIYNVVGGFVGMFAVITNSLVSTTQRYITVELGKGDKGDLNKVFGIVITIHIGLALLMVLLFETVGLYCLNNVLEIPHDRRHAAQWVFQISVICSVLGVLSTPYIGIIVSYERMRAFAFISLQDAILRLLICYALYVSDSDRLILYAVLIGLVSIWNQFLYMRYCFKSFKSLKSIPRKDKKLFKSIFGFAGMNFLGSFAYILSTEGVTIILNMFYGVVLNAARGIATQVQNLAGRFTGDFMTALNPQITKEYSAGNKEHSQELCFRGAKFSFYIVALIAIPVAIRANMLLTLWLGHFPEYTVQFVRLTLALSMVSVLAGPLVTLILAVGQITGISLWIGGIKLLALPLIYICFKLFNSPLYAYYVIILLDIFLIFIRLSILQKKTGLSFVKSMTTNVFLPVTYTGLCTIVVSYILNIFIIQNIVGLFLFSVLSVISSAIIIYTIGMKNAERQFVRSIIGKFIKKIH